MPGAARPSPPPPELVGRDQEFETLRRGLDEARGGRGVSFLVTGPVGMGKSSLLQWLAREGATGGAEVRSGSALRESIGPFFLFQQVFRTVPPAPAPDPEVPDPLPPVTIFEEEEPQHFHRALGRIPVDAPLLLIDRGTGSRAEERAPGVPRGTVRRRLTQAKGKGNLAPGDAPAVLAAVASHFSDHRGAAVALQGVEYLATQTSVRRTLDLVGALGRSAEATGGHLLLSVHPGAFPVEDLERLEAGATVLRFLPVAGGSPAPSPEEPPGPPSETLVGYLSKLMALSRSSPQLLLLDDLHWADPQSANAFVFLVRNLAELPVMLVATAREEELLLLGESGAPSLAQRVEVLGREGSLTRIRLRRIDEQGVRDLAGPLLGSPLAEGQEEELRLLVERTGGNPYFVRESLLQLRQSGDLREGPGGLEFVRVAGGASALRRVPPTLRRLVLSTLDRLRPEERRFLQVAALAGSHFELDPISTAFGAPRKETEALAQGLRSERRLISPAGGAEPGRWAFSHVLVAELLLQETPAAAQRAPAGKLLAWWRIHHPEDLGTLARLARRAGGLEEGLPLLRAAFEDSLARFAPEAAMSYLLWLDELLRTGGRHPTVPESVEEMRRASRVSAAGAPQLAAQFLRRLLLDAPDDRTRVGLRVALARAQELYDSRASAQLVDELFGELGRDPARFSPADRHAIEALWARQLFSTGAFAKGVEVARPALEAPLDELDLPTRASAAETTFFCWNAMGRSEEAQAALDLVDQITEHDPELRSRAVHGRLFLAFQRGDWEGTVRLAQRAALLHRQRGHLLDAGICEYNAGICLVRLGRLEEAERTGSELVEMGRRFDLPRIRSAGEMLLGKLAIERGTLAVAEEHAQESLRAASAGGRGDDVFESRVLLTEVWLRSGDAPRGLSEFDALEQAGAFSSAIQAADQLPVLLELLEQGGHRERAVRVARRLLEATRSTGNVRGVASAQAAIQRLGAG